MAATLRDVARLAGVSFRTVSNVVNGYRYVSEATRAKVEAEIEELGYQPNYSARSLRLGRSDILGVAVTDCLIGLGHRRIAMIGAAVQDRPVPGTSTLRMKGYRQALEARGIASDPALELPAAPWRRADGAAGVRLSSVDGGRRRIADMAVSILIDRIENPGGPADYREVGFAIVERESTRIRRPSLTSAHADQPADGTAGPRPVTPA